MKNSEKSYSVGDKVTDPVSGFAIVTFVGSEYVGLRFERNGQDALFRMEGRDLYPGWDESVLIEEEPPYEYTNLPWPDSTFIQASGEDRHFLGSHWDPFLENGSRILMAQLPDKLEHAKLLGGFGDTYRPARPEPESWPKGAHLEWPEHGIDVVVVVTVRFEKDGNYLTSLYPYAAMGTQLTLKMERVKVWEGGVEAQIEASWREVHITFFDCEFLINRGWYDAGRDCEFLLAGIAYQARPAENLRLPYTPNPDDIAWNRMLTAERGETYTQPTEIDLSEMACLLPIDEWDKDDYSFRGIIRSVKPFKDFLGNAGWKARTTVMRSGDEDADLDIFITARAWEGNKPPEPGQNIEGSLWLQGRLWSASQAWEPGMRSDSQPSAR